MSKRRLDAMAGLGFRRSWRRLAWIGCLTLAAAAWGQGPSPDAGPPTPTPLTRTALLKKLASDPDLRQGLSEQITALGGDPDAVLNGTAPARPGEDVKDLWHQGALLTPKDSQILKEGKLQAQLVVYNVFMHSLKECLEGNFLPVTTGPGSPYAAAGLFELPGPATPEHPWIVEVGFELEGLRENQIRLQVNHKPVPALRFGETALLGFVRVGGGRHFVEITQPPADPRRRTRRFWYTRLLRL